MPNACKSNGSVARPASGGRVRNTYETCPLVGNTPSKGGLMPHTVVGIEPDKESCFVAEAVLEEGRAAD